MTVSCDRLELLAVSADMTVYVTPSPRDFEADVLEALEFYGVEACTVAPEGIEAGTIRVSRTGGHLYMESERDRAEGLIEVWGATSVHAFDLAIRPWAVIRSRTDAHFLVPGVPVHDVTIDPPRAMDDPHRPHLYRVQFAFQMTIPLADYRLDPEEASWPTDTP